jgi:uncharacterized protein YdcH (DUF465 family)
MAEKSNGLMKRLLEEDESFRKRYDAHRDYEKQVDAMEKKSHLSVAEMMEKKRLKKLKLALKDEMEQIIAGHRG